MTKSHEILTTPPIHMCQRCSSKDVSYAFLTHPQDAYDTASHRSSLPSGNGVACFLLSCPLPHAHTLVPHTLSLAFGLPGEADVKPQQSAHIGSPELPCYTQPVTTAPTSATLPPALPHQTQLHADAVSPHIAPRSRWRRTGGHLPFPE
ncbi:hypothetical protein mRhiFer1_010249 [Rhinolophus ferrumequinum]|uniref:Uncharacterized protein n=1 Tax=Rhinolophus ferrumequinum TaxID=59479 RepID=A0A7J7X5C7_RHIFE|nr:hypothetical protein mRhiFer1_010249 [Rhinolophus ferrumequinum]